MTSSTIMTPRHVVDGEATRTNDALEVLLELLEREADHLHFKHTRVARPCGWNMVEFTISGNCGLTLDLEANRSLPSGVRLKVGVFRNKLHEKCMKLEDHSFAPKSTAQAAISWEDQKGTNYTPQELCRFLFDQLREHTEQCYRQAEF